MFEINITPLAESDMQSAVNWWKEHRSAAESEVWYMGLLAEIQTLTEIPTRCRPVQSEAFAVPIRQLLYGVSAKPTHRILFGLNETTVTIYRILHTSQKALGGDERCH